MSLYLILFIYFTETLILKTGIASLSWVSYFEKRPLRLSSISARVFLPLASLSTVRLIIFTPSSLAVKSRSSPLDQQPARLSLLLSADS